MKTLKLLLLVASLSFVASSSRAAETQINFEDGAGLGGQPIGAHYAAMGVSFGNAVWVAQGTFNVGNTPGQWRNGAAGLGAATGCYHDANYWWQSPCSAHPITATFSPRVTSVSITSFNPGINGVRLTAFDSDGNVVGTDQFIGQGAGTGTRTLQVTASSTPIDHIALDQPVFVDGNDDGVTFDDLSFQSLGDIKMLDATTTDFEHIDLKYSVAGNTVPAFIVRAYISSDEMFDQNDLPLLGQLGISDVSDRDANPDGTAKEHPKTMILSGGKAPIGADRRFVIVVADPDGAIQETNENNNTMFVVPLFVLGEKMNRAGDKNQNLVETDPIRASGPFTGAILRGTEDFGRLIRLDSFPDVPPHPWGTPPFTFGLTTESEPWQREEDRLAQPSLLQPVTRFVQLVHSDFAFRADSTFSINEAYDSTGVHLLGSLHYEGRALDLQVFNGGSIGDLSRLCGIAWLAGFDFVFFEPKKSNERNHHVHVSKRASFVTTIDQQTLQESVIAARLLGLIDNDGIATALNAKLEGIDDALLTGNEGVALRKLGAFNNFIGAQSGKHINNVFATLLLLNSLILEDRIQHLAH